MSLTEKEIRQIAVDFTESEAAYSTYNYTITPEHVIRFARAIEERYIFDELCDMLKQGDEIPDFDIFLLHKTLEKALEHKNGARWAYHIRKSLKCLPEDIKRQLENKVCGNLEYGCKLRRDVNDLAEDLQALIEKMACKDIYWALWLRLKVKDLSPSIKKVAEDRINSDPYYEKLFKEALISGSNEIIDN